MQSCNFLKLAKTRKTTYEFSDKNVNFGTLKKILEAARWAPSCSNTQPWHFIVVKDEKRITEMMKTAFYGEFHTNPPLLIAIVMVKECWKGGRNMLHEGTKLGVYDAFLSIGMAALNMALEAHELGISSAFLSPHDNISRILKIRKGDYVPVMVALGYEKKKAFQKEKKRKDLKGMVSGEYFGRKMRL